MSVCALPIVQVDSTNHTITTKEYVCRSKNGTFFLTKCLFNSPSIEPVLLFERRKELQKGLAIPVTFNNVRCDFSLWTHNAWKALVPIGAQRSATLWVTENRMELLKHRTKFSAPWGWVGDFYNMPPHKRRWLHLMRRESEREHMDVLSIISFFTAPRGKCWLMSTAGFGKFSTYDIKCSVEI